MFHYHREFKILNGTIEYRNIEIERKKRVDLSYNIINLLFLKPHLSSILQLMGLYPHPGCNRSAR